MSKHKDRFNIHHRRPVSLGGTDDDENLSQVRVDCHNAWHTLFRNMEALEIVAEINKRWLDPKYFVILKLREQ